MAFTGIDATLATLDTGALSASGTGAFAWPGLALHRTTHRPGGDGAPGLDVTLDGQGAAMAWGQASPASWRRMERSPGMIAGAGRISRVLVPAPRCRSAWRDG